MKILDIREISVPLRSSMSNAVFDFSEMTTSVVAVITDVQRGGQPVVGYAFNSTGRYACGAVMRSRMIPRLLKADPDSLLDAATGLIDPARALACMMQREKPGAVSYTHPRAHETKAELVCRLSLVHKTHHLPHITHLIPITLSY